MLLLLLLSGDAWHPCHAFSPVGGLTRLSLSTHSTRPRPRRHYTSASVTMLSDHEGGGSSKKESMDRRGLLGFGAGVLATLATSKAGVSLFGGAEAAAPET